MGIEKKTLTIYFLSTLPTPAGWNLPTYPMVLHYVQMGALSKFLLSHTLGDITVNVYVIIGLKIEFKTRIQSKLLKK